VLSPFLLWKPASRGLSRLSLRACAAVVLATALVAGWAAIGRDLSLAYRSAPSPFTPEDLRQFQYVRDRLPAGEALLVVATRNERWHACLWQRALYPRNPAILRFTVSPGPVRFESDQRRFGIRHAVAFGSPLPDPGFERSEDVGQIPTSGARVVFGPIRP
jgi:hypothetical protein